MKLRFFMQSQSDDRKLASDDSHWSASAKNFVLKGQWKTELSRRPFRTQSSGALFQPLRSWLISAVPSEQKSAFHPCSIRVQSVANENPFIHQAVLWLV